MLNKFQKVDSLVSGASMPETPADIAALHKEGIRAIVSLESMPYDVLQAAKKEGIKVMELPLDEYMPPSKKEVHKFLRFVNANVSRKRKVFVHCFHGVGRTREMLAFYLVGKGISPLQAHSMVGGVETLFQKEFLLKYGERLQAAIKRAKARKKAVKKPKAVPKKRARRK